jgi:hypothetical protein
MTNNELIYALRYYSPLYDMLWVNPVYLLTDPETNLPSLQTPPRPNKAANL